MTSEALLWERGAELPARTFGPVTRTVLALYAGGSGDHNPIHIDSDFAHFAGQSDVFAHGMLSMAYLAQYISRFASAGRLRSWSVRFIAVTPVNTTLTCSAHVVGWDESSCEATLALAVRRTDDGTQTVIGEAVIAP